MHPFFLFFPFIAFSLPSPSPSDSDPVPWAAELNTPCGGGLPDCPTLTCIPLSPNCTVWNRRYGDPCPGTCQYIDITHQHIYTVCGGWGFYDDCDERFESCIADPRHDDSCGPSCDGMGICHPNMEICGFADWVGDGVGYVCPEGKACFMGTYRTTNGSVGGACFPLRYGSDYYEKTKKEEVIREDQNGDQREDGLEGNAGE
ncbi:hypothetical protein MFIFM68171_07284 [Madurella fahalii]|uniref:Uncharacterized protein n=1 Tax=Madurella fahalii TaxID=1157608 RepID=A0ABQ0GH48_9PEZI